MDDWNGHTEKPMESVDVAAIPLSGGQRPVPDRAFRWSLAGHGLLLLVVLIGGLTLPRSPPPTQLAIKASVVDPNATRSPTAPQPAPRIKPKPQPEPQPEATPAPQPEPKPEPKPDPRIEERRVEQQKQEKDRQEAARREKNLVEKQRTEKMKAEQAEEKKKEKEKQAREKAAADKLKAEQLKAEQVKAARLKEEAAAAREIARQLEAEERLLAAAESGALADYQGMISQKVTRNWIRPPSAKVGLEAVVLVTQIPGGEVISAQIVSCNGDEAVCRSIEAAVLKASPLPLPDDPALFDRSLRFTFKPEQ